MFASPMSDGLVMRQNFFILLLVVLISTTPTPTILTRIRMLQGLKKP